MEETIRHCKVCGERKVADQYGVLTCDPCSKFFRRNSAELTKSTRFLYCKGNQKCKIMRSKSCVRRCDFCRYKKCVAVGMTDDEEKSQAHFFIERMGQSTLWMSIGMAYRDALRLAKERVDADIQKVQTQHTSDLFCLLNLAPQLKERKLKHYDSCYRNVCEFSQRIPGFDLLSRVDQTTLLMDGLFQVLFVIMAHLFDSRELRCLNGQIIRRGMTTLASDRRSKFLNLMFETAEKINHLDLLENEKAIFCSVIVVNSDLPGLEDKKAISLVQQKLRDILQNYLPVNHPDNPNVNKNISEIISSLTYLNAEHMSDLGSVKGKLSP